MFVHAQQVDCLLFIYLHNILDMLMLLNIQLCARFVTSRDPGHVIPRTPSHLETFPKQPSIRVEVEIFSVPPSFPWTSMTVANPASTESNDRTPLLSRSTSSYSTDASANPAPLNKLSTGDLTW
jgi:hypothetical protein